MAYRSFLAALAAASLLLAGAAAQAQARDYETETGLKIERPWARQNLPSRPGAAYMTIRSAGEPDRLIAAHSPAFGRVELHTHKMEDGVMKMRKVESLSVAPGEDLLLKPHGNHLMLFDAKTPMQKGDMTSITLVFEKGGEVEVMVDVLGLGETPKGAEEMKMDHQGMDHDGETMKAAE